MTRLTAGRGDASRRAFRLEQVLRPQPDGLGAVPDAEPVTNIFSAPPQNRNWEALRPVTLSEDVLLGHGIFLNAASHAATASFDILRTRVFQIMQENGWKRLGVTACTARSGTSFVAVNLALACARRADRRTVLLDLVLSAPTLHRLLGITPPEGLNDCLSGDLPPEAALVRVGHTLALGLNTHAAPLSAEFLQADATARALDRIARHLRPDLVICDLPPALLRDDAIAMAPQLDAVMIVADGTQSTAAALRRAVRVFDGGLPILGVVLNRAGKA